MSVAPGLTGGDVPVGPASRAPLYRSLVEGEPSDDRLRAWPVHDHDLLVARSDPFGGRCDPHADPVTIVQACADAPVYWGLSAGDLDAMGATLATCWRSLGLVDGDRVLLYDYGSSPVVLFASNAFVPHLGTGAAELTGCVPICNDGLVELADRAAHVVRYVGPSTAFVGGHAVEPLVRALAAAPPPDPVSIVVTADEDPWPAAALTALAGGAVRAATQLLRIDLALLLAPPCSQDPTRFHPDPATYVVEVEDPTTGVITDDASVAGRLVVTHRLLTANPVIRYASDVVARVAEPCSCGWPGRCVAVAA
jgi:hypothetical protein